MMTLWFWFFFSAISPLERQPEAWARTGRSLQFQLRQNNSLPLSICTSAAAGRASVETRACFHVSWFLSQ